MRRPARWRETAVVFPRVFTLDAVQLNVAFFGARRRPERQEIDDLSVLISLRRLDDALPLRRGAHVTATDARRGDGNTQDWRKERGLVCARVIVTRLCQ